MRLLFTSNAGVGHFLPLVPTAVAARDAGHDVTFAAPVTLRDRVRALGFEHVEVGFDPELEPAILEHRRHVRTLPVEARREYDLAHLWATLTAPRMLADLERAAPELSRPERRFRPLGVRLSPRAR